MFLLLLPWSSHFVWNSFPESIKLFDLISFIYTSRKAEDHVYERWLQSPQRDSNKLCDKQTVCAFHAHVAQAPQFGCCVYFLFDPSTYPQPCMFMCMSTHCTVDTRQLLQPPAGVSLTLSFCGTVSVCLDIIWLFFIVTVCLCVTDLLRSPRDGSVWGNRKKHSVSAYYLGHCYQPHAGAQGHCPTGNKHAFGS